MRFYAELTLRTGKPLDDALFDAVADALADRADQDAAVTDAGLGGSLASGVITASMGIEAPSPAAARTTVHGLVRAAVQQAGAGTAWNQAAERAGVSVVPSPDPAPR